MRDLADQNGLGATNYEGPASFVSYLAKQAQDRGIPMATIVAGIPPYVHGRNMIAIEAVFRKLVGMGAVNINFDNVGRLSAEFREGLDKLVRSKPELEEQVRELEQAYDEELGTLAEDNDEDADSQEDLGEWFNRQGIELE
jgi:DNA repair photolyase